MWSGWTYTQPLFPCLLAVALWSSWRGLRYNSRRARRLAFAAVVGILLWSWPPLQWLFALPFEWPYRVEPRAETADVIVVFGGGIWKDYDLPGKPAPTPATYRRCLHAAWLYESRWQVPIVATGTPDEARIMAWALQMAGVPSSKIVVEDRSKNTWESVRNTAELTRQRGWKRLVVVTEAYHMRRVVATYRRFGISPIPAACGFFTLNPPWSKLLPSGSAIRRNELLLHELVGNVWYALRPK